MKKKIIKFVTIIAILAIIGVSIFEGIKYYLSIPKDPNIIIEKMVQTYYEEVLYDKIKGANKDNFEFKMDELSRTGIKETLFTISNMVDHEDKHLLLNSSVSKIDCDFYKTNVNYIPVAPYSKTDYKYDLNVSCKVEK